MNESLIRSTIISAVQAASGNLTTIWENQNAPRPALPYCAVSVNGLDTIGQTEKTSANASGFIERSEHWEFTISVQVFGVSSAFSGVPFVNAMNSPAVIDTLATAGIVIFDNEPVSDITELIDTDFEPRFSVDFFARFNDTVSDNVGIIETISGDLTVKNGDEISMELTF